MPWVCLRFVIVVSPDHTHLLFLTFVVGAQKNCLNETVLLITHNICFSLEIRNSIFNYTLLFKGLQLARLSHPRASVTFSLPQYCRTYPNICSNHSNHLVDKNLDKVLRGLRGFFTTSASTTPYV